MTWTLTVMLRTNVHRFPPLNLKQIVLFLLKNSWRGRGGRGMHVTEQRGGAAVFVTLYMWTGSTPPSHLKQKWANCWSSDPIDPHITHSSISPPLLHIENITLYFTRGLGEQNIYYFTRNSAQAKYVQQTCSHHPRICEHMEQTRDQCETEPSECPAEKNLQLRDTSFPLFIECLRSTDNGVARRPAVTWSSPTYLRRLQTLREEMGLKTFSHKLTLLVM